MNPHVAFHARMPRRYWLLIVCGAALVIPGRGISRASTPDRSNYLQQPYSEEAFSALMKLQNQQPTADMESWKISGVFRAERQDQPQLTVVAIDRDASTPGCIVVLGPHGEHLRTLRDEAVNLRLLVRNCEPSVVERERDVQRSVELVASSELESVREKLKREEVVQLVDLNGDGSAEIPTRGSFVKRLGNLEAVFEFESVYLTADESIPRRFRIEFNPLAADEVRGPTGSWENCHLARAGDGALAALGTLSQPVIPVREITVTRADGRVEQREEAATRDFSQPPRTLATFRWSDEQRTFVGPQHGPARLWLVVAP